MVPLSLEVLVMEEANCKVAGPHWPAIQLKAVLGQRIPLSSWGDNNAKLDKQSIYFSHADHEDLIQKVGPLQIWRWPQYRLGCI